MDIKTDRLNLVPICKNHAKELLTLWSNEDVIRYTNTNLKTSIVDCEEYIDKILKISEKENSAGVYTVYDNEGIIGVVGAPTINYYEKSYGLFYQIKKEHWGRGYGLESAKALVGHMFETRKVNHIYADSICKNNKSINILKKLGMNRVAVEENRFEENNEFFDIYNYSICRNEWEG
ncbi:N-acetyltransferase [Romboutsia weinsteinii]|uniref:N-acetyltransferase n=1 Tax=Romboutsia weinsteinii TaxID=2020949 RepID=A0A371J1D6_9FIRM|nr:GNAT family N-acetyltransferase [Romboutsia weinsteinii]RDY26514.1 N-acetyltransferase [Romboutsia weinsteinii]